MMGALILVIIIMVLLAVTYAIVELYELTVEDVIDVTADEAKETVGEVRNASRRIVTGVMT